MASEAARLARLKVMGIDVWRPREAAPPAASGLRVRLAAGDGDWLILTDCPLDGQYRALMADITATLGRERCRFGQWTDNPEAGMDLDELAAAGIRHVLALGGWPEAADAAELSGVVAAPPLPAVHGDADARRSLWRALRGVI